MLIVALSHSPTFPLNVVGPGRMNRIALVAVIIVVLALVGGAVFFATWDIPPPSAKVEKVLPNDRFPR
jgi:hypothetical protein